MAPYTTLLTVCITMAPCARITNSMVCLTVASCCLFTSPVVVHICACTS